MNLNVDTKMNREEEASSSGTVPTGLRSPPVVVDWKKQREDELGLLQQKQLTTKSNLRSSGTNAGSSIPVPINEWHQQMLTQKKSLRTREQDATQYLHSYRTVVDESPSLVTSSLKDDTARSNKLSHPPPTMYPPTRTMTQDTPTVQTTSTSIQAEPRNSLSEQAILIPSSVETAAATSDEEDYSFVKVTTQESDVSIKSNYVVLPTERYNSTSTPEPGNNHNSVPDSLQVNTVPAVATTHPLPIPTLSNDFITNSKINTNATNFSSSIMNHDDAMSAQSEDMDGVLVDTILVLENDSHLTATTTVVQEEDKTIEAPTDTTKTSPIDNSLQNMAMTTKVNEKASLEESTMTSSEAEVPTFNTPELAQPIPAAEVVVAANEKESLEESTIIHVNANETLVTAKLTQPIVAPFPEKEPTESAVPKASRIETKPFEESKIMNDEGKKSTNELPQPVNWNTIIRVQFSFDYTTSSPIQHTQSSIEQLVSSFFHQPILENDHNSSWILHYPKHTFQVSIQNVLPMRPSTFKHNVTVLVTIPIQMNGYDFQQHIQDATKLIISQIKSHMTHIST